MGQSWSAPPKPGNSTQLIFSKSIPSLIAYDGAWYGMICLAGVLLVLCAVLAGLTLAVCGLNTTFLQLRCVTGTPRQRRHALVVAKMKRHHSWMLCSLIIFSVLCGESLPFVVQSLWDNPKQWWVPIIVSTLSIAFFAEIAPQYWVPRHAIKWGYYCWPVIWGCMWITCPISWPLSKLLDYCSGTKDEVSIFSNDELAGLIKYHEKSAKHGGLLGPDTSRVMLGALSLESHRIGSNFSSFSDTLSTDSGGKDSDPEKAELVPIHGIVVNWSSIKTVDIDEVVDRSFVRKLTSWSYSRIPVVGEAYISRSKLAKDESQHPISDTKKIFGVLHIKNLIGLKIPDKQDSKSPRLTVRDLQIYPLPIVMDEMPAYSLLNMFHSGVSRMAIVIPTHDQKAVGEFGVVSQKTESTCQEPCWTGTQRTNDRIKSQLQRSYKEPDWTKDLLKGTLAGIENPKRSNVMGVRCPEPLGIVTFEDIIDAILNKASRNEREFYTPRSLRINTSKNSIESGTGWNLRQMVLQPLSEDLPIFVSNMQSPALISKENNLLRKRNLSNKAAAAAAMDGADDRNADTEIIVKKERREYTASSYTQNSQGGFHGSSLSSANIESIKHEKSGPNQLGPPPPPSSPTDGVLDSSVQPAKTLPSRKEVSPFRPGEWNPFIRRNVTAMPNLPDVRRVSPFSRLECSSFTNKLPKDDEAELIIPRASMLDGQFDPHASGIDINHMSTVSGSILDAGKRDREDSGDTISLNSSCHRDPYEFEVDDLNSQLHDSPRGPHAVATLHEEHYPLKCSEIAEGPDKNYNAKTAECMESSAGSHKRTSKADEYEGFPPELLEQRRDHQISDFSSKTLPRVLGMGGLDGCNENGRDTPARESSFHDDRALLPSQTRALKGSTETRGQRSTSIWF